MVNITLSIPKEIRTLMRKYPEIKWSEVSRSAIINKLKDLELLEEIKEIEKKETEIKKGNYYTFKEVLDELGVDYNDI